MWKIQTYSEHVKITACTCHFVCLLRSLFLPLTSTFFVLMSYMKYRWRWHIHVSFLLWFWACCMSSTCANDRVLTYDSYTKCHNCALFIESAFAFNYRPFKLSCFCFVLHGFSKCFHFCACVLDCLLSWHCWVGKELRVSGFKKKKQIQNRNIYLLTYIHGAESFLSS